MMKTLITGTASAVAMIAVPTIAMAAQGSDEPATGVSPAPSFSTAKLMGVNVDYEAAAEGEAFAVPARNFKISATFGQPGYRWSTGHHTGLDFAGPLGSGVVAADSGKVVSAEPAGAYGNMVQIRHADGIKTRYAHLNSMEVKKGDQVKRGQRIGTLGSTGNSSGPHLHFEVLLKGKQVDPMRFLSI